MVHQNEEHKQLLEIVDANNSLIGYFEEKLAKKQHCLYRSVAAIIRDEKKCAVFHINDDGSVDLPLRTPLFARSCAETILANLAHEKYFSTPFNICYLKTYAPIESLPYAFTSLYSLSLPNKTLATQAKRNTSMLLLDPIEQKGLFNNTAIRMSPFLAHIWTHPSVAAYFSF